MLRTNKIEDKIPLAWRQHASHSSVVDVDGVKVGGERVVVMGGPCAVESAEQLMRAADAVREFGASILRGGAYKPRTSPYSFQGLGEKGLELLAQARERTGLKVVTEVVSPQLVERVAHYADVLQVGARNMQNYPLLEAVGAQNKPVLLKRGLSATIEEWLLAAEYVLARGNPNVILCERGIRTFEPLTRNTLDLGAVVVAKQLTHLPVVVDPSHAIGLREGIVPLARAAIALGADGLLVETHPEPEQALCDGAQALPLAMFSELMHDVAKVASVVGRRL